MKRISGKILSLLLSAAILCGPCVPPARAAESPYSDTQGHWAEAAIDRWSGYGVVQGYDGSFQPDASVTRAQMATILAEALGLTDTAENPFTDVSDGAWYAPGILRCYAAGILQGSGGKADPERSVTRQEAMVMMGRALCIAPEEAPDLSMFADRDSVDDWAAPLVAALVKSGMVGGVGNGRLDSSGDMSRAALLTVLDRAVVQYVNSPGSYELTDKNGIVLVAAGDVILTGKTSASILVTPAADGKALTFDKASVTGSITVQADGAKITAKDSKLPEITATGTGTTVEQGKPATGGSGSGGSSGGSGGGGGGTPAAGDLTVSEAKTVTGGTYQNVTIAPSVGDGTVTLDGVTIRGTLTVNGGGSHTVHLTGCAVQKVVLDKTGGEAPRLNLTNTPVAAIEAVKPAILEADAASAITAVTAKADVEVKGANTAVAAITVPADRESAVEVKVTAGAVAKVEAKGETTVTGAAGSVAAVVAEAPVTVASGAVAKVEVPATAGGGVTVAVTGDTAIEVEVNSADGAAITAEDTSKIEVSTALDTPSEHITVGGVSVAHIHKWDAGKVTIEATCAQAGLKTYTCTAAGCTDPVATKAENIPALPHTVVIDPAVAATCTEAGKTEGKHCSVCDTVLAKPEVVPALGHKWGAWTADGENHVRVCANDAGHTETEAHAVAVDAAVDATCTEAGKTEGKHCSVCNTVITAQETLPALGHDFTGAYVKDADGHWHKCTRCDATDEKAAHSYGAATCTEATACTVCGYEKPAGQHTWGAWAYVDETNHKHTCSVCNTAETKPHAWDAGVVTKEPTEAETGVKTFTCTDCQGTKTEVLPVVSSSSITLSADGTNITLSINGFDYPNYYYKIVDGENNTAMSGWSNENTSHIQHFESNLPRCKSGTETYSVVIYSANASFQIGDQIARLDNCIEMTVAGEAVNYEIQYNTGTDTHSITWTPPENTIYHLSTWYKSNGNIDRWGGGGGSGSGSSITQHCPLADGHVFDLRAMTSLRLDNNVIRATITPPSTKTYTAVPEA